MSKRLRLSALGVFFSRRLLERARLLRRDGLIDRALDPGKLVSGAVVQGLEP